MILIAHGIIGGAVGSFLPQNPILAFFVGLISHFVFDAIPHWHYPIGAINPKADSSQKVFTISRRLVLDVFIIALDFLAGVWLAMLIFDNENFSNYSVFAGVIGGLFPDAIMFWSWVWRTKIILVFQKFHQFVHTNIYLDSRAFWGPVSQAAIIAVVILISLVIHRGGV